MSQSESPRCKTCYHFRDIAGVTGYCLKWGQSTGSEEYCDEWMGSPPVPVAESVLESQLTDQDWLQIEQAANGCVSGTSDEWPALRHAIETITGKPFVNRKSAAWLQGFCEGVLIQSGRIRRYAPKNFS